MYTLKPERHPTQKTLITQLLLNLIIATTVIIAQHQILSDEPKIQRMALIKIDDKTYRQWGSPILTPRDKLKSLIEKAEQGGANVIVVNLNLTRLSDGCFHAPDKTPACSPVNLNTDVALGLYLQKLNEEFHHTDKYDTPIILLGRTYRQPLDKNGTINTQAPLEKPYSFLDAYIKKEKNIFWTSTFFIEEQPQLAALVCQDEHLTVVPSMPLLATMAQLHSCEDSTRKAAYMIQELKQRLNAWAQSLPCNIGTTIPQICKKIDCPELTVTLPKKAGVHNKVHTIDLTKEWEKIVYRHAPPDEHSALKVLTKGAKVDKQIVFIGDTHHARSKEIDSVYFIANAVDTLLRFGQLKSQPLAYKISIDNK
ncbi:MAG: CHASE2 domain-containing protein [Pseudomonadota bacterium]